MGLMHSCLLQSPITESGLEKKIQTIIKVLKDLLLKSTMYLRSLETVLLPF